MNYSLDLNPHHRVREKSRSRSSNPYPPENKKAQHPSEHNSETFGLPDSIPEGQHHGIVRVDLSQQHTSATTLILDLLEEHRSGCTSCKHQNRLLGKYIPNTSFGCVLKSGKPIFLRPSSRYLLPPTWKWVLDPETESPFDRVRTDCGDITFLNLSGNEVAIVEDPQLHRWALNTGFWIVFGPARVIAMTNDIETELQKFPEDGLARGYVGKLERQEDRKKLGQIVRVLHQHVVVCEHRGETLIIPGPSLRVFLNSKTTIVQFLPLTVQHLSTDPPVQTSMINNLTLSVKLDVQWEVQDVQKFITASQHSEPATAVDVRLRSLVSNYCSRNPLTDAKNPRQISELIDGVQAHLKKHFEISLHEIGLSLRNVNVVGLGFGSDPVQNTSLLRINPAHLPQ